MRRKIFDDITYEELDHMERYALCDAAEAHGDMVGYKGTREDKQDYDHLEEKGLLKRVMVKSGRQPEFGYLITEKGWQVWHEGTKL